MAAATEAYQKLNSPQKLVEFGTRLYAQSPNGATAYFVAKAYESMNDRVNFSKWAEKTLQHDPGNVEMLVQCISSAWGIQDLTKAASYANRGLKALDTMPAPAGQNAAEWKAKTDPIRAYCLRALGEEDYRQERVPRLPEALPGGGEARPEERHGPLPARLSVLEGGRWSTKRCASFARAAVLSGPTSSDARKQLNDLYKQSYHNLVGVPKLLQSAKDELGVQ